MLRFIEPLKEIGGNFLNIDKPGRYVGGEIGKLAVKKESILKTLIAFPDLYEIGMGNQALRIIYNNMNNLKDVSCDFSFAPAPDFEKLLREKNIPLYGLDTGISLACVDLLMFTLGYELGLNGILTMMDVSGIPLHSKDRNENHPIIIAGGPAVSNPEPYTPFIDAFWIGEAEAGFFELAEELSILKKEGQGRIALLKKISAHPNIYVKEKENVKRAIMSDFTKCISSVYPVPSMKIIQHHGTVEIMRGCPNGCRFCHAGFWYRPARQKDSKQISSDVREMVTKAGWQEISLSSLSSGDYCGIEELIENLNYEFADNHVSFQLPSLKVSSFALPILEKISVTRKSGLTFAVETPKDAWQMSINKSVTRDSVAAIIEEAKKSGWRGAKFYFMIGLPLSDISEEEEIISFVTDVGKRSRMHFNINIGIFIPKPHTPYQWAAQINSETAEKKLLYIKSRLKPMGHKVSISDPLISKIEGLLSRGDEKAGYMCEEAWKAGSRLDPWSDFINRNGWLEILNKNSGYVDSVFSGKTKEQPWAKIDSCVTQEYLCRELEKSDASMATSPCKEKCSLCGVCKHGKTGIVNNLNVNRALNKVNEKPLTKSDPTIYRVVFSFCKEASAVFHGHLSLIEIFSLSFRRAAIPVMYTLGFNPLAKIEFASPLATGISAMCEIAAVDFTDRMRADVFISGINKSLPDGIRVTNAECFMIKSGLKKHSLSSLLWGFEYAGKESPHYVRAKEEKIYRQSRLENDCNTLFDLKRNAVLAKTKPGDQSDNWALYFDVYRDIYK